MSSGEFDWVAVAKAPIGGTCSRRWSATGYWIRAVSGAFIEYGLSNQRWAICLQKTSRLRPKTLFIDVWILWSNIKQSSLSFCTRDGRRRVAVERMDRSQPQIAGTRSVGTFGFQLIQKLCQKGAVQILKREFGLRALQASLCKLEQQTKSVPIRADGVRAYFALCHQAPGEEGFKQRGK